MLDKSAKFFLDSFAEGGVAFFAGSGISTAAGLPSAAAVLEKAVDVFLPSGTTIPGFPVSMPNLRDLVRIVSDTIQPEVFYELVLELTGSDEACLLLWRVLHHAEWERRGMVLRATPVHDTVVRYSHSRKVPIFTTNFDTLFEESATRLGLPYGILDYRAKSPRLEGDRLNIVKIHGSIADAKGALSLGSLLTTMSEIAVTRYPILSLMEQLMRKKHLTMIGYSGRDLDLFPQLVDFSRTSLEPIWVNDFRTRQGEVDASREDYVKARTLTKRIVATYYPDRLFFEAGLAKSGGLGPRRRSYGWDGMTGRLKAEGEEMLLEFERETARRVPWTETRRLVLLGSLLGEVGRWRESYQILDELYHKGFLEDGLEKAVALKYLCAAAHNTSRYETMLGLASDLGRIRTGGPSSIAYRIVGQWYQSEYRRMRIPFDTFIFNDYYAEEMFRKHFIKAYLANSKTVRLIEAEIHELHSGKRTKIGRGLAKHKYNIVSIRQNLISLRLNNLVIEAILLRDVYFLRDDKLTQYLVRYLRDNAIELEQLSREVGYARGYRDCYKLVSRLSSLLGEASTFGANTARSEFISHLLRDSTATGILARHRLEHVMKNDRIDDLLLWRLTELYKQDFASGNLLESIKSLLLIAESNRRAGNAKSLSEALLGRTMIQVGPARVGGLSDKGGAPGERTGSFATVSLYDEFKSINAQLEMPLWKRYLDLIDSDFPRLANEFSQAVD